MSEQRILLGFEVPTGEPVYVNLHHLAIFGMTQKSGKTTTLEALITRSKLRAIAFNTKRGESGFHKVNVVTPYYKPRSDWQFIEGLVNVALGEKVKYEPAMRWAIMKVSEGTQGNLRKVLAKAEELKEKARKAFIKQTFEKLVNYLKIVVPELEKWTFSAKLSLDNGVNVMDLTDMKLETQQIVIASTIEYIFENLTNTVVVIPEAWETLPQSKMTPVKWVAERFIRKGASIGNYLWIDSQDIGGIDKTPLRQCDNWLMGRMKEAHEVERIIKQLLGHKISLSEIQTLPLGHFFAVIGDQLKKVYVLPVGVPEDIGRKVASGTLKPEHVRDEYLKTSTSGNDLNFTHFTHHPLYQKLRKDFDELKDAEKALREQNEQMRKANLDKYHLELKKAQNRNTLLEAKVTALEAQSREAETDLKLYDELRNLLQRIMPQSKGFNPSSTVSSSQTLNLNHKELQVNVKHASKNIEFSTETQQGQIMYVALNDLPKEGFTEKMMSDGLKERGWNIPHTSLAPHLSSNLVKAGLLIKIPNTRPTNYKLPSKVKINVEK